MDFSKKWLPLESRLGKIIHRPILEIEFEELKEKTFRFIVDSGADVSLAPRHISDELKLDWDKGIEVEMSGIAKKEECIVEGRIHDVDIIIPDIKLKIRIPICFAEGDAPFLLGREGFMDYFDVKFKKQEKETIFELIK